MVIPAGNSDRLIILATLLQQIDLARRLQGPGVHYADVTIEGRWIPILREAVVERLNYVRTAD